MKARNELFAQCRALLQLRSHNAIHLSVFWTRERRVVTSDERGGVLSLVVSDIRGAH